MKHRTLISTIVTLATATTLSACAHQPAAGPAPASAPPPKPLPVTALRPPGYTFRLTDDPAQHTTLPDSYTVTYLSGGVTLRSTPRVLIGFRVDPSHPGQQSELLATNTNGARTKGFGTTPVTADGGSGITFVNTGGGAGGADEIKSVIARGPVTVTVNVDADPANGGTAAAKELHDQLVKSLHFREDGLSGSWPGTALAPQLPVTVDVPSGLARDSYDTLIAFYSLDLNYGTYKTTMVASWQDATAATSTFADIKSNLAKAGVRHQNDVRTLPALRDSLGQRADEGFAFSLTGSDGIARYVGVLWRKGGLILRTGTNIGNIPSSQFTEDSNSALAAPMANAKSWSIS